MGAWRALDEDDLCEYGVGSHAAIWSRAEVDAEVLKPGRPIGYVVKGEPCQTQDRSRVKSKKPRPARKRLTSSAS